MLCQKCHKNLATVRYAEVVNGKVTDLHLCQDCLGKQQDASSGFELGGPTPVVKTPASAGLARGHFRSPRKCKTCGIPLVKILDSGKVGCRGCYVTFARELEPLLLGLHGSTIHQGKAPHVDDMRVRLHEDLQNKRRVLRSAVQGENYEEAALLRDEIRQLETVLGASDAEGE